MTIPKLKNLPKTPQQVKKNYQRAIPCRKANSQEGKGVLTMLHAKYAVDYTGMCTNIAIRVTIAL